MATILDGRVHPGQLPDHQLLGHFADVSGYFSDHQLLDELVQLLVVLQHRLRQDHRVSFVEDQNQHVEQLVDHIAVVHFVDDQVLALEQFEGGNAMVLQLVLRVQVAASKAHGWHLWVRELGQLYLLNLG